MFLADSQKADEYANRGTLDLTHVRSKDQSRKNLSYPVKNVCPDSASIVTLNKPS